MALCGSVVNRLQLGRPAAYLQAAYERTDRTVWIFDSFQGLPPPNEEQFPADRGDEPYRFPQLAVSLEEVTENFRRVGLLSHQVTLVKGWFKDTVPDARIKRFAVLRLDGDLYESTIQVLEALYSKLSPGGFCIIYVPRRSASEGRSAQTR